MIKKSNSVAIYLRLSEEDYDVTNGRDGLLKEESDSIANQRKLIDNYLKKRNEFNRCQFNEYCDDGFSGTNFERPDFQKMLRDAESGKIDTIVFKDYSRLGRNFLGVGKYLEEILPELEIRVISINDGYDSNNILETSEGISIPMKNLINDYYVKDLSKKVKSAIKSRQTRGQFISACAIFGYKKDPWDKHQLIIDEETAPIIKKIFKYALDGMNGSHIAKKLIELEILTPAWYSGQSKKRTYEIDQKSIWTSAKVMKIIRDQRYTGDMVGNVRVHTKIAKGENRRVDRKDWIIVEDTHEGIISKEIFYKVNQEVMPLKEREKVLLGDARRKGFCYCAECGRLLQRTNTTTNVYLECNRGKYQEEAICSEICVSEKSLCEILSGMIKAYISTLIKGEALIKDMKYHMFRENKAEMTMSDINTEISKLLQSKMGLYERYRDNSISKEEYLLRKRQLTMHIEELESRKVKIVNGIGNKEEQVKLEDRLAQIIKEYKDKDEFSYVDISQLVSKVIVRSEQDVSIVWRFKDITEDIMRFMLQQLAS